jgi:hypothetical protein
MELGPTLIHIKLRAGVWVCPRKTLSIDPIDAAEPSEPSHDEYRKPIGTVTVARNSRMRSTEGYCRSNNQREPKSAAVSGMRQEFARGHSPARRALSELFSPAVQPLKVGIHNDIIARHPEPRPSLIASALKTHTRSLGYLETLKAGAG